MIPDKCQKPLDLEYNEICLIKATVSVNFCELYLIRLQSKFFIFNNCNSILPWIQEVLPQLVPVIRVTVLYFDGLCYILPSVNVILLRILFRQLCKIFLHIKSLHSVLFIPVSIQLLETVVL